MSWGRQMIYIIFWARALSTPVVGTGARFFCPKSFFYFYIVCVHLVRSVLFPEHRSNELKKKIKTGFRYYYYCFIFLM